MQSLEFNQAADATGTLHLNLSGQEPNREYRVVVVVQPRVAVNSAPRDKLGWPIGFFERLAGSWQGEFIEEYEGDFEQRTGF
jgi:hypothetical protein